MITKNEEKISGIIPWNNTPSGHDYSIRPNWVDLSLNYNNSPKKKQVAIIVTSWGHLHFLEATLKQYIKSGAFVICAYDNPIKSWEISDDVFKNRMPDQRIWIIPNAWVFKHVTYDCEKRDGWLWLINYSKGILLQYDNFEYIIHVNGDCLWENPEGLQDLIRELGEYDLMSISSQPNSIHTCAVIYKREAFKKVFSFMEDFIFTPVIGSFSPEKLLTEAVRKIGLNEKIASVQPMEFDNSSIDHYSRYDQDSTWKRLVGYKNLGSIFLTSLIERTEPVSIKYVDVKKMRVICKGYSESLANFYETGDRRWLYKAWDENEDSWYDRVHYPIEHYGEEPIFKIESKNKFEQTKKNMG